MSRNDSTTWDIGRFLKTVAYFGQVPLLSSFDWFQQLMGSRVDPIVDVAALNPSDRGILFDFTQPLPEIGEMWGVLDDVVMGGASQSEFRLVEGMALFTGIVSTANSGGFTSVRTRNITPPLDLSSATGIALHLRGDGKRYKFMVRCQTRWDGVAYCYSFDTIADTWITVQVPFTEMIPVFRARTLTAPDPLDTQHICAFQLMLSKFEYDGEVNPNFAPGEFCLAVQRIATYCL